MIKWKHDKMNIWWKGDRKNKCSMIKINKCNKKNQLSSTKNI